MPLDVYEDAVARHQSRDLCGVGSCLLAHLRWAFGHTYVSAMVS